MPGIQFNGRACAQETSQLHSLVPQKKKKRHSYLSMVAHTYNLSTQEAETGRLVQIQGQPEHHSEILSQRQNIIKQKQVKDKNKM